MKLIVGLGNPGDEYEHTRHNVGFMAIDEIAKLRNYEIKENASLSLNKQLNAEIGTSMINNAEVKLAKPMTYMNDSGQAVKKIISQFPNFPISSLIIVHDDITLDLGHVKISKGSGAGNHNGVQSIIDHLKTKDFIRVRCGIGRGDGVLSDVVLSKFIPDEKVIVTEMVQKAADVCVMIVEKGLEKAMNWYN